MITKTRRQAPFTPSHRKARLRARWCFAKGQRLYILNGYREEQLAGAQYRTGQEQPGQVVVLERSKTGHPVVYGVYKGRGRGSLTPIGECDHEYQMIAATSNHCAAGQQMNIAYFISPDTYSD